MLWFQVGVSTIFFSVFLALLDLLYHKTSAVAGPCSHWPSPSPTRAPHRTQMVARAPEGRAAAKLRLQGKVGAVAKLNRMGKPRKQRVVDCAFEIVTRMRGTDAEADLQADVRYATAAAATAASQTGK